MMLQALGAVTDPSADHLPASHAVQAPLEAELLVVPATQAVQPLNELGPVNAAVPAYPAAHVSKPGVDEE